MNYRVFFTLVNLMALASACSTVTTPVLRHETGETLGQGHFRINARIESGRMFPVIPAGSAYTDHEQFNSVFTNALFGVQGAAGVLDKADVQFASFLAPGGGGWRIGAKYQVYGAPRFGSKGAGNIAVAGILGYGRHSAKGNVDYQTTGAVQTVTQVLSVYNIDISVPVSYRFSDTVVAYSGASFFISGVSGSADTAAVETSTNDLSVNLGVKLTFGKFEGSVEFALARVYDPFESAYPFLPYLGLAGGFVF